MDIVWLKRDVRLHDHGPISAVAQRKDQEVCFLYLYEPDQLAEHSVHGSHVAFVNEGLLDLDQRISGIRGVRDQESGKFHSLTVCHAEIVETLQAIQQKKTIARILAHQETGHMASFERDKRVRRWCKRQQIPFIELQQTGVTRGLKNRDEFSRKLSSFLNKPRYPTPTSLACSVVTELDLPGRTWHPLLETLTEIPPEHRVDRQDRQSGGEARALEILESFLERRGAGFSKGISSPNSSWTSCSRLSPYLSWGHVSLRHVFQAVKARQAHLREQKVQRGDLSDPRWLKSLAAFSSRLHWRSHFMQKLEMEPELEKRDPCNAYASLRRQPGDWNEANYQAWATGQTGFPLVDACMRCLHQHGWINFRMRAMLVSFASYNLWLDWKKLAPHLARLFLDYEPGIHYPQLHMQSGTTGINAMRVYNVTKQGKDQDPKGIFIRKYVPELQPVPEEYIHEPWKMPSIVQARCNVYIGADYPAPIVDEQVTAREAKMKVNSIRKQESAKQQAAQVYEKHGSRNRRRNEPKSLFSSSKKQQKSIASLLTQGKTDGSEQTQKQAIRLGEKRDNRNSPSKKTKIVHSSTTDNAISVVSLLSDHVQDTARTLPAATSWKCQACTFLNDVKSKPFALACGMCGTARQAHVP